MISPNLKLQQVLLGSAASFNIYPEAVTAEETFATDSVPRLMLYSANHANALSRMMKEHEDYRTSHPSSLADLCYSLATKRETLSHRAFSIMTSQGECISSRHHYSSDRTPPKLVFTFTGQGAQWPQMGKELIAENYIFRKAIQNMDLVLQSLPDGPKWTLIGTATLCPCCEAISNHDYRLYHVPERNNPSI